MKYILYILMAVLCIIPTVSAAPTNLTFDEYSEAMLGPVTDIKMLLIVAILALVSIVFLIALGSMIVGKVLHNEKLFTNGAKGCIGIVGGILIIFFAMVTFSYVWDTYVYPWLT